MTDPATWISLGLTGYFLVLGTAFDLKTRAVPNWVWLLFGPLAAAWTVFVYSWAPPVLAVHLLFALLISTLAVVGYYVVPNAIGGADVKAIICMSLAVSVLTFLVIGFSALILIGTVAVLAFGDRLSWRDALKLRVPMFPFLTLGWLLTVVYLAVM